MNKRSGNNRRHEKKVMRIRKSLSRMAMKQSKPECNVLSDNKAIQQHEWGRKKLAGPHELLQQQATYVTP